MRDEKKNQSNSAEKLFSGKNNITIKKLELKKHSEKNRKEIRHVIFDLLCCHQTEFSDSMCMDRVSDDKKMYTS